MSRELHRRLDAIAKLVTPEMIDHLEQGTAKIEIADRVESWSATREDFEILTASTIDEVRGELIEEALQHAQRRWAWGPPYEHEGRPRFLAAAAIDYAPSTREHTWAVTALERAAQPTTYFGLDCADPWDSGWFEANEYLVALGPDQGASLHEAVAESMADLREQWLAAREALAEKIRSGDPHRLDFYNWVQPDLGVRRDELLDRAAERRSRRHDGHPLDIDDMYDAAAEIASYLPDEPAPDTASWLLRIARSQDAGVGTPAREEWIEANEMHWILGPDGGKNMRKRLEIMLTEDTPATIDQTTDLTEKGDQG
ncbi:MAG: hypothetical protein ACRCW4_10755 [Candidatus Neomicrothrix subdominans]